MSDDSASQKDNEQVVQLFNALTINAIIFGVALFLFELTRGIKIIYLRRCQSKYISKKRVPPPPSQYPLSWIFEIMNIHDNDLVKMIGLDGYVLLRYLKLCFRLTSFLTFWGLVALSALYSTCGPLTGWNKYTMSNIPFDPNASAFWAPAIFAYIFSGFFCYLLYMEYKHFVQRRLQYLIELDETSETPLQVHYTVIVEDIPRSIRSESQLFDFFNTLFPGEIFSVEFSQNLKEMDKLFALRQNARNSLEQAIAAWKSNADNERPTTWVTNNKSIDISRSSDKEEGEGTVKSSFSLPGLLGYTVTDSIEHFQALLSKLNNELLQLQSDFLEDININTNVNVNMSVGEVDVNPHLDDITSAVNDLKDAAVTVVSKASNRVKLLTVGSTVSSTSTSSTAFVTLTSRVASCNAHQLLLSHRYPHMSLQSAPDPRDIIWCNNSIPNKQINIRIKITTLILNLGILFWSVIVTFITTFGNLQSLSEAIPALQFYLNTSFYQVLNSYIASQILLIFLGLLPGIFDFICRYYEGVKLESEIQSSVLRTYFSYQLANVFVSIGLGSISSSVNRIILQPTSLLSILGESLPNLSFYFTTIVLTKTFSGVIVDLLQVTPLVIYTFVVYCIDKKKCTRRSLSTGVFAKVSLPYGVVYPDIMMILMIMFTYSCISPMILPFCLAFFGVSYIVFKYQLLYVFEPSFESGGFMWYTIFGRSLICLMGGVIALICYLGIRQTFYSGPFYFVLPLPVFIYWFWGYCDDLFKDPSIKLSLESAILLDKEVSNLTKQKSFKITTFRQPSLIQKDIKPAPYRVSPMGEDAIFSSLIQIRTPGAEVAESESDSQRIEEDAAVEVDDEINELVDEVLNIAQEKANKDKMVFEHRIFL